MGAGKFRRRYHPLHRHAGIGERNVVPYRTVEQHVFLQDDANLAAQPGNVDRGKSDDGLLLLLRARWRAPALGGLHWLRPQVGLEYGGTTNVFQTADLAGVYAGAYLAASNELGFTVDYWTGKSHYESGRVNEKRNVGGLRIGLAFRY